VLNSLKTVPLVNQVENKLLQDVHVHPDKLTLMNLVFHVSTDVTNVKVLPPPVLNVPLTELTQLNVTVMNYSMMMDILLNVNHVEMFVPLVKTQLVV